MKKLIIKIYLIISNWFKNNREIPIQKKREYIIQLAQNNNIKVFIESGTFMGDTIDYLKDAFEKLYSIELSHELADRAKEKFKSNKKIEIFEGDSSLILFEILMNCNTKCLFWLDGHYSSEFFVGDEFIKTAKGKTNTPILNELEHILKHPIKDHIILIDDARLFDGRNDYPTLKNLKRFIKSFGSYKIDITLDIITIRNSINPK